MERNTWIIIIIAIGTLALGSIFFPNWGADMNNDALSKTSAGISQLQEMKTTTRAINGANELKTYSFFN